MFEGNPMADPDIAPTTGGANHEGREGHEDLIAPGRETNPKSEYRNPKRTLNQISQTEGEGNHKEHKDRTERTFCVLCVLCG